jgi:hypothetical protein
MYRLRLMLSCIRSYITSGILSVLVVLAAILFMAAAPQEPTTIRTAAGQSRTLMPDGTWLLVGGILGSETLASAAILNPVTGQTTAIAGRLNHSRAWHTAVLLPDGTVLIVGGVDPNGHVLSAPETFDPAQRTFRALPYLGLSPRAYHSATLLTDGTVLLAAGVGDGGVTLNSAELWDFRTGKGTKLAARMISERRRPLAMLQADGTVRFTGGAEARDEVYLPWLQSFQPSYVRPGEPQSATLAGSVPESGAIDVSLNPVIGIRFSRPLKVTSLNPSTVIVGTDQGHIGAQIVPAELGMLVFVTPKTPLSPGVRYTVVIADAEIESGVPAAYSILSFTAVSAERTGKSFSTSQIPQPFVSPLASGVQSPSATACKLPPSMDSWVDCVNNNKAGLVKSVGKCIPPSPKAIPCSITVTRSTQSAQPACALEFMAKGGKTVAVQFPRIILDCVGVASPSLFLKFRPSYTLCPKEPVGTRTNIYNVELGEDETKIKFVTNPPVGCPGGNKPDGCGSEYMGDVPFPSGKFEQIKCEDVLSQGDGFDIEGTKRCNKCHDKPKPNKAPENSPQLSPPINPFGMFGTMDLSKLIIFTNVPEDEYPGSKGVPRDPDKFLDVCSAIGKNKKAIAEKNGVKLSDVQNAYDLCCALFQKATGKGCPTS